MTEYRHPGSESMGQIVSDLERHRGPGPGKALWRSWLFDGWRFGAVDLSSDGAWPRVVGLACGDVLSRDVQERLVRHLRDRGGLLLLGPVPTRDTRGRACTVLADALGVRAGQRVESSHRHFASVRGVGPAAAWDEMRVDWWQPLTWDEDEAAVPLVGRRRRGLRPRRRDGAGWPRCRAGRRGAGQPAAVQPARGVAGG